MPPIGAHVSSAGGLDKLIERALELGVETVQLHPSAPQSYRPPQFSDEAAAAWRTAALQQQWQVFFHGIYLINLASEDERLWHASIESVAAYLRWAPKLAARGSITHIGSHKGRGIEVVLDRLTEAAEKIAAAASGESGHLIIENTAGGGGTLGRDIGELSALFKVFAPRLPTAVCLDTCHLFAAGVDWRQPEAADRWWTEFDRQIGLKNLAAIHLNDSQFECGSRRDRHANLGEGMIGEEALAALVNDPRLATVPFILEVPGSGHGPDRPNIARAQGWRH